MVNFGMSSPDIGPLASMRRRGLFVVRASKHGKASLG
jgi:hypothetical protein